MTVELEVYSRTDPRVRVDHLPHALKPKFLEERDGVGGGSFAIHAQDSRATDPTILQDRNIVRCKVDGKFRSAFIIQKTDPVYVGNGEREDLIHNVSGNGLKDWLRDAVVHTEFGIVGTKFQNRSFNFASNAVQTGTTKTWYDEAKWVRPKQLVKFGGQAGSPFRYQPANWPDAPDSYWMWPTPAKSNGYQEEGFSYFRTEFKAATKDLGAFSLFCAADDIFEVYVDGQLSHSGPRSAANYQQVTRVDFDVEHVGTHVVAIKVQNTGGRAGLIATIFRNGDAAKKEKSRIVIPSKAANWWVVGYPTTPPNWTVGEIWNQLLKEAKARGVRFAEYVTPGFTEFKDSNGSSWNRDIEWNFTVGEDYLSVAEKMQELAVDIWIDPEDYRLMIARRRGLDRTVATQNPEDANPTTPVVLRVGHHLTGANQKTEWDVKNSLIVNTNSKRIAVKNSASIKKYGVIEDVLNLDADTALSKIIADKVVADSSIPTQGANYTVIPREQAVPFEDYSIADWIMAPGSDGDRTRRRIEAITISVDDSTGAVEYGIEFDSVFHSRQARLERWIKNTMNGSMGGRVSSAKQIASQYANLMAASGNSGFVVPPVPPVSAEVQSPTSYYTESGVAQASVALSWDPVVETEDGLETEELGYEIWGSNVTVSSSTGNSAKSLMAKTSLSEVELDRLEPNSTYQLQIVAVNSYGLASDFSETITIETPPASEFDTFEELPVPSVPYATSQAGSTTVLWDGAMEASELVPPSVEGVKVFASDVPGGPYNIEGPIIPVGGGACTLSDLPVGKVYYIVLATKSKHGSLSGISEEFEVISEPVKLSELDAEITASIDKAQADADEAADAAANAQTTANGKNARRRGLTEPEPPTGGWVPGDEWIVENDEGAPVKVMVWNGTAFVDDQILSSDLLILGPDGTVRVKDSKITAPMISVGALDFKTANGLEIYGGKIVGGSLELADYTTDIVRRTNTCDSTSSWFQVSGPGSVVLDTVNKYEGVGSIRQDSAAAIYTQFSSLSFAIAVNTVNFWVYSPVDTTVSFALSGMNSWTSSRITRDVTAGVWTEILYRHPTTVSLGPGVFNFTVAINSSFGFNIDFVRLLQQDVSADSGVKIFRDSSGAALIESTTGTNRTRMTGGGIYFDKPDSPGAGVQYLGPDGYTSSDSNSRMSIWKMSSAPGVGVDITAGSSPSSTVNLGLNGYDKLINLGAENVKSSRLLKPLISTPGVYMQASQSFTLAETVASQLNGILLEWSYYADSASVDSHWHYTFIPKQFCNRSGYSTHVLARATTTAPPVMTAKLIYLDGATGTVIRGHAANNVAATNSQLFVLRGVYGV